MVDGIITEEQLREAAIRRIKKRRDFRNHLVAYVIVNAFLVVIWYFTGRGYFWPMWVMIGWGIGLAFNAWDVYGRKEISDAEVQAEMEKLRGRGPDAS
jgi:hypothetical protein